MLCKVVFVALLAVLLVVATAEPVDLNKEVKGLECDVCKQVCEEIIKVGVNEGLPEIEKGVNEVCNKLGSLLGSLCTSLVDGELTKLIAQLKQSDDVEKACKAVDLC